MGQQTQHVVQQQIVRGPDLGDEARLHAHDQIHDHGGRVAHEVGAGEEGRDEEGPLLQGLYLGGGGEEAPEVEVQDQVRHQEDEVQGQGGQEEEEHVQANSTKLLIYILCTRYT